MLKVRFRLSFKRLLIWRNAAVRGELSWRLRLAWWPPKYTFEREYGRFFA